MKSSASKAHGQVRIIGGTWRGRKIPVPDVAAVRPSSDRVRETLFNWLMPRLPGAHCLDLFAGSGVLGFEALSRGAASATFVDTDVAVQRHLAAVRDLLAAGHTRLLGYDAGAWLASAEPVAYDIVFVDPPFAADLVGRTLALLTRGWVAPTGVIYVEAPAAPVLSPAWQLLKQGQTRQVTYSLLAPSGPSQPADGET